MSFDRFNDKPVRSDRGNRFSDRPSRSDRFGGDRQNGRFGDRTERGDRFSDRGERRFEGRNGRPSREGDRFSDRPRRSFGDKPFGARPFGDKREGKPNFRAERRPQREFSVLSGPRARALEKHRYSDRVAFSQTSTVRLDADVAKVFTSAEAVNAALRQVIALAGLVKRPEEKVEETVTEEGVKMNEDVSEASEADFEDDDMEVVFKDDEDETSDKA